MISVYEDKFKELTNETFEAAYEKEVRMGRRFQRQIVREASSDRTIGLSDITRYIFFVLCRFYNRPLPASFEKYSVLSMNPFDKPKLSTDIIFLASPARYKEDLHVYFGKISDEDKAELIKKRGWAGIYILPKVGRVTNDDVAFTKKLANPSDAVFEWSDDDKKAILDFSKSIGIPVIEKTEDVEGNALFEEIVKELLRCYNPQ